MSPLTALVSFAARCRLTEHLRKEENISAGALSPTRRSSDLPTSAQVMISRSVSSSPASGSVLTAQSLEPVSDSVSPSLSDPPPFMLCLSLSQK